MFKKEAAAGNIIDLSARITATRAALLAAMGPTFVEGSTRIEASLVKLLTVLGELVHAGEINPELAAEIVARIEPIADELACLGATARTAFLGKDKTPDANR